MHDPDPASTTRLTRRQWLAGASAMLGLFGLGLAGCVNRAPSTQPGATAAPAAQSTPVAASQAHFTKDQLVWAYTGALSSFDPLLGTAQGIAYNAYEQLVDYKVAPRQDGNQEWVGGGEVAPRLAESWDVNGASVTFHLRKGVKFYPSKNELTADDVKWSFLRGFAVKGSTAPSNGVFANLYKPESQIEVLGKYDVKFTFTNAKGTPLISPMSMESLAFYMFPIWDSVEARKQATDEDGNRWAEKYLTQKTLGSGPYYVASYTQGVETILQYVGDEYYRGPAPQFKRVVLRIFSNFSDIVPLIKQGEVDAALGLPIPELENLAASGAQVIHVNTPDAVRYFYALEHPALSNKLVRQALAYGVPYDQVINGIYKGRAERATGILNPKDPNLTPVLQRYTFDQNQAKELLRQSGVALPFSFAIFYDSGNPIQEDVSILLKDAWSQLGLNVTVTGMPTAQFTQARRERIAAVTTGQPTTIMSGVIMNTGSIFLDDPQAIVEFWLRSTSVGGSTNASGFKNAEVDALQDQWGPNGSDLAGRKAAYARIQDIFSDELPMHVVATQGTNLVLAPGLRGYRFVADNSPRYWSLTA
jgi:peptide/nickel transport system substrate-binding protein